jgi:hypothetical protein
MDKTKYDYKRKSFIEKAEIYFSSQTACGILTSSNKISSIVRLSTNAKEKIGPESAITSPFFIYFSFLESLEISSIVRLEIEIPFSDNSVSKLYRDNPHS